MRVLLLLAGRSERFWPLSDKMLMSICGKTLLEHQVERLRSAQLTDITLIVGPHNHDAVKTILPSFPTIEQEDMEGGTRAALLSVLPACGSDPVLIVCGNDVVEPTAYEAVLEAASAKGASGALLAQKRGQYFPGGYLSVHQGRITSIVEKPEKGNEPSDLVNIEVHAHNDASALLQALKAIETKRDDGYEQALASLLRNCNYRAVPYEGFWQAVKYPWHVLQVLPHFLCEIQEQSIDPSAEVHPAAVIDGNIVLAEGARVFPHTTVRGPCFIGPRTIVANGALVRGASIGSDCVIGFSTEIKDSVLSDHVWTHMSYIGDSVIGRNVAFGAGCVTGNLRLDEAVIESQIRGKGIDSQLVKFGTAIGDDTRLGIQVGINPGVKIGGGSFVAGGTFVAQDIPYGSFVCMRGGMSVVSENRERVRGPESRRAFRNKLM